MNGLQIDLVLMLLVAFAFGLCVGRGNVTTLHMILTLMAGLGALIVMTNVMAALQLIGTVPVNPVLLLGRVLAFSGAVSLILVATRNRVRSI